MGIFTRTRDIVNANINAALDKAENPEKLVRHMIREMEDTLVEIKAACANAMAGQKKAQRDLEYARSQARHWGDRAEMAVDRGRDELAREALQCKHNFTRDAEQIQKSIDELDHLVGQYKGDIVQIEEKMASARERQRVLVQRHIRAQQHRRVQTDIRKLDTSRVMVRFEEFEGRLDRAEAESDLINYGRRKPYSLEDEFQKIERDETIEAELRALKDARRKKLNQAKQYDPVSA